MGSYSVTVEDSSQPLVVVLTYTDEEKPATALKRSVVNSLSLRVCTVGDITTCTTPGANSADLLEYSNVQKVTIPNPSGTYTIEVVKTGREPNAALDNYTTA